MMILKKKQQEGLWKLETEVFEVKSAEFQMKRKYETSEGSLSFV